MDTLAVEQYAVDAIRNRINYSDHLSPFVSDNDKEPSWDGHIYIYGSKKNKENLTGRIPVQVKGSEQEDLSKVYIKFRMDIADLHNYLNDGGCLLFVVYIKQDKATMQTLTQIYYRELTPVRLKELLTSTKDNAKSTQVTLARLPDSISAVDDMVLNCYSNCKKQTSFAGTAITTYEELVKTGLIEHISIPLYKFSANTRVEETFLATDSYVYAKIRGVEALQPLAVTMCNKRISHNERIPTTVNGNLFYNNCNVIESATKTVFCIGKGLTITSPKETQGISIKYNTPKMLKDYVQDQSFMIAAVNNSSFDFGGLHIDISPESTDMSQYDISVQIQRYEFFAKVDQLFDRFGCERDLDITTITYEHAFMLYRLVTGIIDKQVIDGLRGEILPLMYWNIASFRFLIGFEKTDKEGAYILKDLRDIDILAAIDVAEDQTIYLPKYAALKKEDFLSVDNIPFEQILDSFRNFSENDHIYDAANMLLLEMIKAFDTAAGRRKERLYATALGIAEWLCDLPDTVWNPNIAILNKLQIIKRERELSENERDELYAIIESCPRDPRILTGAYLLLGEKSRAKHFYTQMTAKEQIDFSSCPIYRFS